MPIASAIIPQTAAQARAAIYLFFARLFREAPSEELLRQIVNYHLLTLAELSSSGQDQAAAALDPAEDARWSEQAEAIGVEYARLFVVPGEQAVRPYESAYYDRLAIDTSTACSPYFEPEPIAGVLTGFLHGPSANAVRDAYQHAGFSVEPGCHELPDHLAIELEFMGRLIERGDVDYAKAFFADHLGRWAFRCLEEIRRKAAGAFYRAAADALASFLRQEAKLLVDANGRGA